MKSISSNVKSKELEKSYIRMDVETANRLNDITPGRYLCCHCVHHEWLNDKKGTIIGERCHLKKKKPICEPCFPIN